MGEQRWWDKKPFNVPQSLDDLHGPSAGMLRLDRGLIWMPGRHVFSLDNFDDRKIVYVAVLGEGTLDDVCALLNRELLVEIWCDLNLPLRVIRQWEERFPVLRNSLVLA